MEITEADVNAVTEALSNDNLRWHTVREISEQSNLPVGKVLDVIASKPNDIVLSANKTTDGENLYSLREVYDKRAPFLQRVICSLKNRVD